jgi:hypothetical protein
MSDIRSGVLEWLFTGQVGASSKAMAAAACGLPGSRSYPSDPDDLNRCLLLLEKVPAIRDRFAAISDLSDVWARLIDRWEVIEQSFLEEVGLNWTKSNRAPKTYALMKSVIKEEIGVLRVKLERT